nr:hypothetical protein [Aliiroseovarius sp. F47248L]
MNLEDTPDMRASDQIREMHQIPGVLTITLINHHFEEHDGVSAAASTTKY